MKNADESAITVLDSGDLEDVSGGGWFGHDFWGGPAGHGATRSDFACGTDVGADWFPAPIGNASITPASILRDHARLD